MIYQGPYFPSGRPLVSLLPTSLVVPVASVSMIRVVMIGYGWTCGIRDTLITDHLIFRYIFQYVPRSPNPCRLSSFLVPVCRGRPCLSSWAAGPFCVNRGELEKVHSIGAT